MHPLSHIGSNLYQDVYKRQEYFLGKRREFSIKLDIRTGTEFQKKAWRALTEIPYGETCLLYTS